MDTSGPSHESLFNAFLYPFAKPNMAKTLSSQFCIEELQGQGLDKKMLHLGALLSVGKLVEYKNVITVTDFTALSFEARVTLTSLLFGALKMFLLGPKAHETIGEGMLWLVRALLPSVMTSSGSDNDNAVTSGKRPIPLHYASHIKPGVKGIVFFRELVMGPGSRKHEFGLRLQESLSSQGWDVGLRSQIQTPESYATAGYDFALIDIAVLNAIHKRNESVLDVLDQLKKKFRKIMVVEPDPWCPEHYNLFSDMIDSLDFVWGLTADWPLLSDRRFSDKAFLFPNVSGFDTLHTLHNSLGSWSRCEFSFVGSLGIVNLPRIYWVLESLNRKLPIQHVITDPSRDDGLSREESLLEYAGLLAAAHVGVNYVSRLDGSKILTGRAAEIISLKRLLLQEKCSAMDSYFIEGEHFLEFSTIEDLSIAIDFIRSHPKTAQLIACEGHNFYLQRYSCKKFVEHFQVYLDA